jgi:hypothetical protein
MDKINYSIKRWMNEQEWIEGNTSESSRISDETDLQLLICAENSRLLNEEIFCFEIFETKSGETFYHSNE